MNKTSSQMVIGLVGNPNSGKSSLFNLLTGLRQKVGNYPGVTVDKKFGSLTLSSGKSAKIIDFPGLYSIYPNSSDERIVAQILCDPDNPDYPDVIAYVADVNSLERHILLATQIIDLGIPLILLLNMTDIAEKEGLECNPMQLSQELGIPVISISSKTGYNVDQLKNVLEYHDELKISSEKNNFYSLSAKENRVIPEIKKRFNISRDYQALMYAHHANWLHEFPIQDKIEIQKIIEENQFESTRFQISETLDRYAKFTPIIRHSLKKKDSEGPELTSKIDRVITHRVLGPIIFFTIMFLVFQAIFAWAEYPMDWIEIGFAKLGGLVNSILPAGWVTSLLTDGIIAGLGGILVFIPQIAILFFLIAFLEEIGYMSRAVFMFDQIMRKFGLNGRSIVALVSGGACAIPAIMSTRTISNWKERLITIMVTPLISCSARIPVYTVLIGFAVPAVTVGGIFNAQGLAFMGLYLLGILAAFMSAWVFKRILKSDEPSQLMMELPQYKSPIFKNVWLDVKEKVMTFVIEAGKIILIISVILWFLASYGPPGNLTKAAQEATIFAQEQEYDALQTENYIASKKIESSFAGIIGKTIEPAIKPLGFDWKIGIALITSFAAREVFVGTMATIYSIGSSDDELTVRDKMAQEINLSTGKPVYNFATSLSLLLFYVFAMQCMSTLAITKRETKSWKWPVIQFSFMSALAYLSSFIVFQVFG
jgi:ferrous iron transport protein B